MKKGIQEIDFNMMPQADGMVKYADRLIMYDNLDKDIEESITDDILAFIGNMPKKIDFAIILLCIEGHIDIDCDLRHLSAGPGSVAILVPGTIARKVEISPDSRLIVLSVPDQHYAPANSVYNAAYTQKNFTSPMCFELDGKSLDGGIDTYRQLKSSIVQLGDNMSEDLVKAYIMVLAGIAALSLQTWLMNHPDEKASGKEAVLKDFLARLSTHYKSHRDVAYYASLAELTPKYFAKVILAASGRHPMDWIREQVTLDAKSMLKQGGYTIGQICQELGFPSRAAFNRYFKDATGMTPMEYIKA